jgi:hypothetical protein
MAAMDLAITGTVTVVIEAATATDVVMLMVMAPAGIISDAVTLVSSALVLTSVQPNPIQQIVYNVLGR